MILDLESIMEDLIGGIRNLGKIRESFKRKLERWWKNIGRIKIRFWGRSWREMEKDNMENDIEVWIR